MTTEKLPTYGPTTGVPGLDRLIGGALPGDSFVLEADSGAPVDAFLSGFFAASEAQGLPVVYVSFNRSPQTIAATYAHQFPPRQFLLVDCFSSGKGNRDPKFLEFFQNGPPPCRAIYMEKPSDPMAVQEALAGLDAAQWGKARYVFDSLTGMLDLWSDEEAVLRFFGHLCPRLYDLKTLAYWILETGAHSEPFLAKLRHITQVVMEAGAAPGGCALCIRKAVNRSCDNIGLPYHFDADGGRLRLAAVSREDRELSLLSRMAETVGSALEPGAFFEQVMQVIAEELGMVRGTLVLLDRTTNKLHIVAAHGLSAQERTRGQYAIGEGVTGSVVQNGVPEVVPDISKDSRFLDRTAARRADPAQPIAFICLPIKVGDETIGALSVDRPHAAGAPLEKDLRLLTIVGSTVSQVVKIHRVISVEKEKVLVRDEGLLSELRKRYRLDNVIGQSEAMQSVLATAAMAAKSRASVLVTGETGTGKELVANVVHYNSNCAAGPFVKVNCGALPETLLESELFGHVKGSFTGALRDRQGRFELADEGTLFLDEVAEMSPRLQVKLLRVLQNGQFEPVGAERTVHVDVRVVAATNRDLRVEMAAGRFRDDLYYRLNVIPIHLPSLRERRQDIPPLIDHFLELYNAREGRQVTRLSREVLDLMLQYPWPGNVRELENCIERAVVMSPDDALSVDILPREIADARLGGLRGGPPRSAAEAAVRRAASDFCRVGGDLGSIREYLVQVAEETAIRMGLESGLSRRRLADQLEMSRTTLRKKMRDYGIE